MTENAAVLVQEIKAKIKTEFNHGGTILQGEMKEYNDCLAFDHESLKTLLERDLQFLKERLMKAENSKKEVEFNSAEFV